MSKMSWDETSRSKMSGGGAKRPGPKSQGRNVLVQNVWSELRSCETYSFETSRSDHFMIVKLPGSSLACDTPWDLFMIVSLSGAPLIVKLPWASLDCETSWSLLMVVIL